VRGGAVGHVACGGRPAKWNKLPACGAGDHRVPLEAPPPVAERELALLIAGEGVERLMRRAEIGLALRINRGRTRRAERWQQQGDQQADDADHDQQLD